MAKDSQKDLRAEVKRLRRIVRELVVILHTHVRTDLPPDACLPRMTRLREWIREGN